MPEHSSEIWGEKNFSPLQPPEGSEKPRRDRALRKQNVVVKERSRGDWAGGEEWGWGMPCYRKRNRNICEDPAPGQPH